MINDKRLICGVAAGLLVAGTIAWAQPEPPRRDRRPARAGERGELTEEARERREKFERQRRERTERSAAMRYLGRYRQLIESAKLTDAQKQRLAKLAAEQEKETAALRARHQEQVMALLTAEQRAAWQTASKVQPILARFARLKLTDAQKETIKQIVSQAELPDDPRAREGREALSKLYQQIVTGVLTADQRGTYEAAARLNMVLGRYGRLGLTPEQRATITQMVKTADLPAFVRGREGNEALRKLHGQIASEVLTAAQREKVQPRRRPADRRDRQPDKPRKRRDDSSRVPD